MTTYVFRGGQFVDKQTGEPMPIPERDGIQCPLIASDIPGFVSPIDGKWVDGRSARREHMKVHDVIEAGDRPAKKCRNKKFAQKHGLPCEA